MPASISQEVWDNYKEEIYDLHFTRNIPLNLVIQIMTNKGLKATRKTYYRKFEQWGDAPKKLEAYLKDQALLRKVQELHTDNMKHHRMLRALNQFEGYPDLTDWQLKQIRKHLSLPLRRRGQRDGFTKEEIQRAIDIITNDMNSTLLAQMGYRRVTTHLRSEYGIVLPQRLVLALMHDIDDIALKARDFYSGPRRRLRYMVKGPNRIWSIDGHDKLSRFGFQIYGMIDGYSRRMLGFYCGAHNRTQIAVGKFFLHTIKEHGIPKAIRADKGKETKILGAMQFAFRRKYKPGISIHKTLAFGTSTRNQRIERFWRSLIDQFTNQWMEYFEDLKKRNLFTGTSKFDVMALQFLYMDHLRNLFAKFISIYNKSPIRKQKARAFYLPSGYSPKEMHKYPNDGDRDYSVPPDPELLATFEDTFRWYDDQAYLTPRVREICEEVVRTCGIEYDLNNVTPGPEQPHEQVYNLLRQELLDRERAGEVIEPIDRLKGGMKTLFERYVEHQEVEIPVVHYEAPANLAGEKEVEVASDWEDESGDESIDGDQEYFELQ